MGSSQKTEYRAFTKAVEHLGDRWSLLIVRELALFGPQGFNTLATGLPGHVSRSVLTGKLRKHEEIGLVARDPAAALRSAPYCLTPVEADAGALYPIARGSRSWTDAIADGSVRVLGKPHLVAGLPGWFLPVARDEDALSQASLREPAFAIEAAG